MPVLCIVFLIREQLAEFPTSGFLPPDPSGEGLTVACPSIFDFDIFSYFVLFIKARRLDVSGRCIALMSVIVDVGRTNRLR